MGTVNQETGDLAFAIGLAAMRHNDQVDHQGKPYILHAIRVMQAVSTWGITAMIAAVLHDTVEDTGLELSHIRAVFGDEVATLVGLLTRDPEWGTYMEYIKQISHNKLATQIKIADLKDNLWRSGFDEKSKSLKVRYEKALKFLQPAQPFPLSTGPIYSRVQYSNKPFPK